MCSCHFPFVRTSTSLCLEAHANGRNKAQHCWPKTVGSCCHLLRGACKRTQQLQHCWQLSEEAIHSGTLIAMRMHGRFHEASIVVFPCKRAQHCCATLRRSQNNRKCWDLLRQRFDRFQTIRNKCQHCCGSKG